MNESIEFVKVVKENPDQKILKSNPELKEYLICVTGIDGEKDWELIRGRTSLYEYVKNNIEWINLEESFVMVSTATLDERQSIVAVIKHIKKYFNDSFDIDDYIKGDWSDSDFKENIDLNMFSVERLDTADFMNGDISSTDIR